MLNCSLDQYRIAPQFHKKLSDILGPTLYDRLSTTPNIAMSSSRKSLKLSADLEEAADLRTAALGYRSWNAYVKGLIRYDLLVQGEHTLTLPYSNMPLEKQDGIDGHLLNLAKQGKGERGQLLKRIMERIQEGESPDAAVIG